MEKQSNKSGISKYLPFLWLLIGAVLYVFTVGIHIVAAAVWLAPVFILRFSRSQNVVRGSFIILIVIMITQAVAYLVTFPVSTIPGLIFYIAGIVTSIFIAIPYIADRIIIKRYKGNLTTLVFPVCMLCILYLYSHIPFFGSSFIGFFQYGLLSSQKILSIFGFNSLVFIVLWFASLFNWLWEHKFQWIDVKKPAGIYLAIILAVLIYGIVKNAIYPKQNSKFVFNTKSDYWPTKGWKTSTPEIQGMDSSLLAEMYRKINDEKIKVLSLVVVRNGYIVAEANKYHYSSYYPVYSTSKSYASAIFGIAVDKGYIKSIDQKVSEFFPEYTQGKNEITLRHLLTMSSGLEWPEIYIGYDQIMKNPVGLMFYSRDWAEYVLSRPLVQKPGSVFNYNSGCSYLLMAVLNRVGIKNLKNFIQESLFSPLGIFYPQQYTWRFDRNGVPDGCCGLYTKPRDMAKFGYLFLKGGYWDGKQIISRAWIEESTKDQIRITGPLAYSAFSYGYQWYITPYEFHSSGYKGQHIFVIPEHELVIVFTSDFDRANEYVKPMNMVRTKIIPAIKSQQPLSENENAAAILKSEIARFEKNE